MYVRIAKRLLDVILAVTSLILLSPLFVGLALLIKLDSNGPVFFRQERIGRGLRPFWIYKFRTMVAGAQQTGPMITAGEDPRITRIGRILRRTKADELPQLINVLYGQMSFVGPRPEVRHYVNLFRRDYEEILSIRPGMTDLASLTYCNEQTQLGLVADPEEEYIRRVLPDKIALAKEYVRRSSFFFDVSLILKTVLRICTGDKWVRITNSASR